jgi:imidazolonepropionase-like amidohydrolase
MGGATTSLLIRHGRALDADARGYRACDIRIRDGRFAAMAGRLEAEPGETVIDATGLWLLPGLIDAHVHVIGVEDNLRLLHRQPAYLVAAKAARVLDDMLSRGFTSVRDAGGADASLAGIVESGLFAGPRIFPAGRGLAPPGGQGDFRGEGEADLGCPCCGSRRSITRLASGIGGLRAAVREEIAGGATQIKVMASGGIASPGGPEAPQLDSGELAAIVEEAGARGLSVMAHAYGAEAIRRCVEAGIRSIEHGSGLDGPTAALMAARGAVLVPTLVVFDQVAKGEGAVAATAARILDQSFASIETARLFGVAIGHGSDLEGSAHAVQSDEFRLKAQVMPAGEVIASATRVNATLLRGGEDLGVIAEGARADLVALDADPLADIGALARPDRHLRLVVKDGAVAVDRRALAGEAKEAR